MLKPRVVNGCCGGQAGLQVGQIFYVLSMIQWVNGLNSAKFAHQAMKICHPGRVAQRPDDLPLWGKHGLCGKILWRSSTTCCKGVIRDL